MKFKSSARLGNFILVNWAAIKENEQRNKDAITIIHIRSKR